MRLIVTIFSVFVFLTNVAYPQVTQQWVSRYNGSGNNDDLARIIKVDNSGNVYVTGYSISPNTQYDIVTIKYDRLTGNTLWLAKYEGFYIDCPLAMTVDNNFIYITGYTFPLPMYRDMITIKYNAATGDTVWVKKFNGPGNGGDYGIAIAVDAPGNVYVTGRSDIGGAQKFTTIKYNPAGMQQWVCIYDGGLSSIFDEAHAIVIDASGNAYVTGVSKTLNIGDYLTLKINSSGIVQWAKKYNGPSNGDDGAIGLVLDEAGANVYVAGYSQAASNGYDFFTIKYNASTGDSLASARYNGTGNAIDYTIGIAKDESDNVYVSGYSYGTNAHVNYATVKYNSGLVQQWVSRYAGNIGDDYVSALAYKSGYVYVTGASLGSGTAYDFLTVKYDINGNQLWLQRYNGPGNGNDYPSDIALDNAVNVYVTGYSTGNGTSYDYATIKYLQPCVNPPVVNAGSDTTIYLGYGNQSAMLAASVLGGTAPFSYLWSNEATTQTITVSPTETTSYDVLVTDANECSSSDTVVVYVINVQCGHNEDKVLVCHKGNTICISPNAVPAHLNHGDYLGNCTDNNDKGKQTNEVPDVYKLYTNYPNPFNPASKIKFDLPIDSYTRLFIYDAIGREVIRLVDGQMKAGRYEFEWNAVNFASGIYYYKIEAEDHSAHIFTETKKMVLLK